MFGVFGRGGGWGGPPHRDPVQSAEADLARRFAAGEIDEKEYEQRSARCAGSAAAEVDGDRRRRGGWGTSPAPARPAARG